MADSGGEPIDVEDVSRNQLEPVFAIDAAGRVAFANERFHYVFQLSRDELIGADYSIFEGLVDGGYEDFREAVDTVVGGESEEERVEVVNVHPDGVSVPDRVPAEARLSPIHSGERRLGVLVSLRNITRRKEKEWQLERQNERLEEFASLVSHDLRNPLNVAAGRVRQVRKEQDIQRLDAAVEALDRMNVIIEGTLALAKQGQLVGELEPVALADLLDRCWSNVETGRGELSVECEFVIDADPSRLQNLLENLIRNGVQHGGDSVTVRVGPIEEKGFYFEDDGPGIPAEERESVFEFGYSSAADGNGFGLAIVRWIAEAHGWDVALTEGSDGGARFEFTGVEIE